MPRNSRRLIWVAAFLAGLAAFAWYQAMPAVPDGQPPLVTVDAASMDAFRDAFNRESDRVRMIVLLAPT